MTSVVAGALSGQALPPPPITLSFAGSQVDTNEGNFVSAMGQFTFDSSNGTVSGFLANTSLASSRISGFALSLQGEDSLFEFNLQSPTGTAWEEFSETTAAKGQGPFKKGDDNLFYFGAQAPQGGLVNSSWQGADPLTDPTLFSGNQQFTFAFTKPEPIDFGNYIQEPFSSKSIYVRFQSVDGDPLDNQFDDEESDHFWVEWELVTDTVTPVPEPSLIGAVGIAALAGIVFLRRRRSSRK